ncbi:MAG TPA: TonB-dependent receptor [Longimicrobiales bacterium]|nr:TonB-dependent receptor [Longimicrobiales bacterium]
MMQKRLWSRCALGLVSLACCALGAAPRLHAQGVTTSAVTGTVTSPEGQPLPGMQVVIRNMETGQQTGTLTQQNGLYYISGLQPGGPYRLSVEGIGYRTETRENLRLTLSQTARFDFTMASQAVALQALEVTAERNAVISKGRTGAATTVGDSAVHRLPTISGDFTDFTRLAPQISTQGGGTSAGGRNNRFNTIQIDGAVNNDLFGLAASGTPGGQAGTKPITLAAIKEFQVVLAPFDVRQGGFTGAGVNAITRSGTNEFHGTLQYYGRNQNFVGRYVDYRNVTAPKFGDFSEKNFVGSLGGPILKDRVHFFVAGDLARRDAPNAGVAIGRDNTYTTAEVQPIIDLVKSKYGYDSGDIGEITMGRNSDNVFGRLDFNLASNHHLTVRHNYVNASDDNLTRSTNQYFLGSSLYQFVSKTNSTVAQLNSSFAGGFYNELRVGYTTVRDHREVPNKFPFIVVDLSGGRQVSLGPENFSVANALDQDILELTDDFTFSRGRHTITIGTHNELFDFSNLFARNIYGNYTFASLADLNAGTPRRYEYSYLLPGGRERAEFGARTLGVYAQDQLSLTDRFTLTAGLRLDTYMLPDKPADNPAVVTAVGRHTNEVPGTTLLVNPRVGFNYDVNGDRTLQLRGGAGLFSGRTPYVWISNAYGNTGLDYVRFTCSTPATSPAFVADPLNQPSSCRGSTSLVPNEINLVDPNFKYPQVFRADLAVDRQLPLNVVGTIEGLYTKAINDPSYRELTVGPAVGTVEGRPLYSKKSVPFSNITEITNASDSYSYSITGQLQRAFNDRWSASAAYTYGRSYDVNSLTSSQAFSNWRFNPIGGDPNDPELRPSNYDIPHRVVVDASYRLPWKVAATDLSLIYVGESGQPYSYTYNTTDLNNDQSNGNDLIYVPRSASEIRFAQQTVGGQVITPAQSWTNFDDFINRVDCLREARGSVVKRNACRLPWQNRLDFRAAQSIRTLGSQSLQVTLDVLNFLNLLNSDWGRSEFVANLNDTPLRSQGTPTPDANGRVLMQAFPVRTDLYQISNESSRYRIRLGVNYKF